MEMIRVEEALKLILDTVKGLGMEKVDILSSLGRVLGEDVVARYSIPPWDNSAMDGYAVRCEDIAGATPARPVLLKVVEDLPAGTVATREVGKGEAIRIMTGAPVPPHADTVVKVEDTRKEGAEVAVLLNVSKGEHIRRAGEDVRSGEVVFKKGTALRPAEVGVLSSLQRSFVYVYQRPRVAILSTGDELVDVDGELEGGKIVNSNTYSLASLVRDAGGVPLILGIAKDTREDLVAKFYGGLHADMILSSGGVSVGDYDLVKEVLKDLGVEMKFWKVAMRPGQPLAFGVIGGKPTFGLPGNPVSAMVSFEEFVRPAMRKAGGERRLFRPVVDAVLKEDMEKKPGRRHFVRCIVTLKEGRYTATATGEQGSGILTSMVRANGLIVLQEEKTSFKAGEMVKVQLLDRNFEWSENLNSE
jgi:molybdopterin molybdotransferase